MDPKVVLGVTCVLAVAAFLGGLYLISHASDLPLFGREAHDEL